MNARRRKVTIRAGAVICVLALFLLCQPPPALPQAPFYQGKTITVIAGQEPGGLGDLRLKSILPYLKKHIPGQPNIVPLKESKFITGYSGPEMDQALIRGELDARVSVVPSLLRRNSEWIEKKLVDVHVILQIPKGSTHPRFAHLPELESFARTDKERRLLEIYRSFSIAGATFIIPPGTPPERIRTLRNAITAAYKDPDFFKDYEKITGETPSPLMPDEFDEIIKKLPRNPEDMDLFKKIAAAGPLPGHDR